MISEPETPKITVESKKFIGLLKAIEAAIATAIIKACGCKPIFRAVARAIGAIKTVVAVLESTCVNSDVIRNKLVITTRGLLLPNISVSPEATNSTNPTLNPQHPKPSRYLALPFDFRAPISYIYLPIHPSNSMKLKLIIVTYLIIAGFVGLTFAQNTALFYDNYTVIPGQPETPIISVFEDSQGFIWYTSINGLYRYDGYNTVNFTHDPYDTTTISSNLVRSVLFEDDSGGLWLANFSNLYDRFDKATGKVTRYPTNSDNLGDSIVIGISKGCQDSAGNILGHGYVGEFVKYYIDEGIVEFFTF